VALERSCGSVVAARGGLGVIVGEPGVDKTPRGPATGRHCHQTGRRRTSGGRISILLWPCIRGSAECRLNQNVAVVEEFRPGSLDGARLPPEVATFRSPSADDRSRPYRVRLRHLGSRACCRTFPRRIRRSGHQPGRPGPPRGRAAFAEVAHRRAKRDAGGRSHVDREASKLNCWCCGSARDNGR
jgi:hypothetical protein